MMEKILSIIVPSYNMEALLPRGLESILSVAATLGKLQVIIVNDGSKDRTSAVAHSFEKKHPEAVLVIDKDNGNYGSCINVALPKVTGRFIKIMDADDWYDSANIPEYVKHIENNIDVDVVINDFEYVDGNGKVLRTQHYNLTSSDISRISTLPGDFCKEVEMQAVAYNSRLFRGLDYSQSEGISYTDQEWMFLPMGNADKVTFFPKVIYKYYVGREGQTIGNATMIRNRWMIVKIACRLAAEYLEHADKCLSGGSRYLHLRLLRKLETAYSLALLEPKRYEHMDDIVALDNYLAANLPDIYKETEEFKSMNKMQFRYIKEWRRTHSDLSMRFILYRVLCKAVRMLRTI